MLHDNKWLHKDTPPDKTVFDFIKTQCDWDGAVRNVGSKFLPDLSIDLNVDSPNILKEVYQLYREHRAATWRSQNSLICYGLSLNYNPDHSPDLWKCGSFGHPRYAYHGVYDYYKVVDADKENRIKDDYLDSLGFRKLFLAVNEKPHLSSLFNQFKLPVVRSTVRTVNGIFCYPTIRGDGGMHTDDSPFEVLRINICLSTNGDYGMQYQDYPPFFWKEGMNRVVNTDVKHRAYVTKENDFQRTNLVVGVVPWMNYNEERDEWSLNEYFGKIHPYDMIKQGLII